MVKILVQETNDLENESAKVEFSVDPFEVCIWFVCYPLHLIPLFKKHTKKSTYSIFQHQRFFDPKNTKSDLRSLAKRHKKITKTNLTKTLSATYTNLALGIPDLDNSSKVTYINYLHSKRKINQKKNYQVGCKV